NKLKPSTVTKIANPGNVACHHISGKYTRPSAIIVPHSGVGGCAPKPRKPKLAPVKITKPISNVAFTIMVEIQLGNTSIKAIRHLLAPRPSDANTNCSSFKLKTSP